MAVTAEFGKIVDKAYTASSIEEIVDAPVSALFGVSAGDAEKLEAAFGIKTVGDLGRNPYFKAASYLVGLADLAK